MKKKKQSGITLIALVITIIVLLILAGVSIATLTGENGILTRANDAKVETRGAAVEEAKDLWKAENLAASKTGGTSKKLSVLLEELEAQDLLIGNEKQTILDTGKVTIGSRTIEFKESTEGTLVAMFKKAQADNCEGGDTCTNKEEHLHIGDYVEYNPIATGENIDTQNEDGTAKYKYESLASKNGYTDLEKQVYTVNNDTEKVNWIVLGLSEDEENLLITTGSPVRKEGTNNPTTDDPYLYLKGSTGYINAESELNNISAIYGKGDYAEGARSITVEDINKLTKYTPETDYTEAEGKLYEYGNKMTVKGNGDGTYSWSGASNGYEDGTFSSNHTSNGFSYIENNELKNIPPTDTTTQVNLESTYYYYYADDMLDAGSLSQRIYNKFFNTEDNYYWLASRSVSVYSNYAYFNVGYVNNGYVGASNLFDSDGIESYLYFGVRPVVTLKSGVTKDNVKILAEQTEPTW